MNVFQNEQQLASNEVALKIYHKISLQNLPVQFHLYICQ
jgi:hypothetical protein